MKDEFDIIRARKDTIACEDIVHFNNAGAALMPIPVSDVLHGYLNKEERVGGYETASDENELLDHFYKSAAKLLNIETDEIAFVENATRAWDSDVTSPAALAESTCEDRGEQGCFMCEKRSLKS